MVSQRFPPLHSLAVVQNHINSLMPRLRQLFLNFAQGGLCLSEFSQNVCVCVCFAIKGSVEAGAQAQIEWIGVRMRRSVTKPHTDDKRHT